MHDTRLRRQLAHDGLVAVGELVVEDNTPGNSSIIEGHLDNGIAINNSLRFFRGVLLLGDIGFPLSR